MWYAFAHQLVFVFILTAPFFVATVILLQLEESNRESASHMTANFQRHLDAEQDPAKLRRMAIGLWSMNLNDNDKDIILLHLMRKMSLCFGFALTAYSIPLAIFAYQLQRQNHRDDASAVPPSDTS
jgi:hypothetical protein